MDQGNTAGRFEEGCQEIISLMARVRMVFENHQNQTKVINQLYRMFIPDWDQVDYLEGHPHCGEELWQFVCQLFLEFDRNHHPECQPGGI